jgi:hypothetical protein
MVAFLWLISKKNTLDQYGWRSEVSRVLYEERVGLCCVCVCVCMCGLDALSLDIVCNF